MIFSFIFFTSLCLVHSLPNSVVGAYPGYRPYGHVGQRVTVVSSPGYVQSSQSSFGHGSTGHGGQSDYGHGSNSWNHGTGAVQHGGGASQWNQGESTSWGKEYGSSNRHNVGAQSGYGHSSVGSHSLGHGQAGYGHNSGYGFNQGGYGHQSQFGHHPGYVRPVVVGGPVYPPISQVGDADVWRAGGEAKGEAHETEITRIKIYNFTRDANDDKEQAAGAVPTELPASEVAATESVEVPVTETAVVVETIERGRDQVV